MAPLKKTVKSIKTLKIQGAENIAKAAAFALRDKALDSKALTKLSFLKEIESIKKKIFSTRPTEPCMRNCLNFITHNLKGETLKDLKQDMFSKVDIAIAHLEHTPSRIAEIASKKIKNGSVVFTHCHSSTVIGALIKAKKQGRHFQVHNTETRPRFQGRQTAEDLIHAGIKVTMYVDSAAREALKHTDLVLIGADAITSEGVVFNKIGSGLFIEEAAHHEVPVFVCADSWKFDPLTVFGAEEAIEQRSAKEVWPRSPKKLKIENPAFEKVLPEFITGIISEFGVFKPEVFVEEMKHKNKWMFE